MPSTSIKQQHTKPFRDIRRARRGQTPLRRFGRNVWSEVVHAVTGKVTTLPRLVERAVASGLDREEFENALAAGSNDAETADELLSIARGHYGKGAYWADMGVRTRARDHYLQAMLWCGYAQLFIEEPFLRSRVHTLYQDGYRKAADLFTQPVRPVSIGYKRGRLHGNLRLPEGAEGTFATQPCAILLNGLSSTKEELHYTENALLAADIATLSFDYPGMHEDTANACAELDVEELAQSLCALLASQREIDITRVALYGVSFGARMALYFATMMPERFKAIVSLSAPFDMTSDVDTLHSALDQEAAIYPGTGTGALIEFAEKTSLKNRLNHITAPLLVAGGGKDLVALPEETSFIYELAASADKKLILCPTAGHTCSEAMPSLRHEIAQWIKQRV